MKRISLLLTAILMLVFSAMAQIKMIVHLNDAESIELYASSVDSITFTNIPADTDDEDLDLPRVDAPGEGFTTIVLYIPESDCEEAEPYILGVLDGYDAWSNEPERAMESLGNGWWQVTVEALTPDNATNFKFRMEDGFGGWSFYPIDSYELLEDAAEYIQIKDEEQNNLLAIASCDNKVLYIKSGKWSDTPCKAPIPAGHAKFIFTPTGYVPEGYDLIFTGSFAEKLWYESDRVMTKEADGTYSWEGDYPENFHFKVLIKDWEDFDMPQLWLDGNDIYVEPGAGSVIRFSGCFSGFCPDDEDLEIPEVEKPGRGKTTIVLYIPDSDCDEAIPYILGVLPAGETWINEPENEMESLGEGWWKVTLDALTAENATNFKFRMEDGAGTWTYEPMGSYELLDGADDYLQIKADERNNLVAIDDCSNKVLYIKSGNWSTTPCEEQIPAGYAKFVLNVIGDIPEDAEVIFTGSFEENAWGESDRVMTKEADGIYSWEGEYPENFRFKAFISNLHELGYDFEFYYSWLNSYDFYVESGAGSVIGFESCFMYFCPGDEPIKPDDGADSSVNTNGHEYVDLGLSSGTLWATMNIGAESPEEYGYYFAWGETQTKTTYNWRTYELMTPGMSSWKGINKYTAADEQTIAVWYNSDGQFIGDNKTTLELEDDVAHVNWGGDWRIPTKEEQDELLSECTWTWTINNGIKGYTVTGPNGNSIFLPATGYRYDSTIESRGYLGSYWGSTLYTDDSSIACSIEFNSNNMVEGIYSERSFGLSVRPVLP